VRLHKGKLAFLANSKNSSAAFSSRSKVLDGINRVPASCQDIEHRTVAKEKRLAMVELIF
jgi:hypothetical protein